MDEPNDFRSSWDIAVANNEKRYEAERRVPAESGCAPVTGSETADRRLADYLASRRRTIESSVAGEALAGNEFKLACEKTALAEITAIECWLGAGGMSPNGELNGTGERRA